MIVWLTGMAGTGKSTIARELAPWLKAIVLDSDDIRGCWTDLGFSREDKRENTRRLGALACVLARQSNVVVACIAPYRADRAEVAHRAASLRIPFHEVFVGAHEDTLRLRRQALYSDLPRDLAGVTSPYEGPRNPIAVVDTTDAFAGIVQPETMARILEALHERGLERIGRDNAGAGI